MIIIYTYLILKYIFQYLGFIEFILNIYLKLIQVLKMKLI